MSGVVSASQRSYSVYSIPCTQSRTHLPRCSVDSRASCDRYNNWVSPNLKLQKSQRFSFRCNSTGDSGENEGRTILDAFFLGRAFAEALSERAETAVGEFLSTVGRLQAEQQKQVQEFQEEVLEKARRAKEQAAREAIEARGVIPQTTATGVSVVNGDAVNSSATSIESNPSDEDSPSQN